VAHNIRKMISSNYHLPPPFKGINPVFCNKSDPASAAVSAACEAPCSFKRNSKFRISLDGRGFRRRVFSVRPCGNLARPSDDSSDMPTTRRYCTRVLLMASSCSRCIRWSVTTWMTENQSLISGEVSVRAFGYTWAEKRSEQRLVYIM